MSRHTIHVRESRGEAERRPSHASAMSPSTARPGALRVSGTLPLGLAARRGYFMPVASMHVVRPEGGSGGRVC